MAMRFIKVKNKFSDEVREFFRNLVSQDTKDSFLSPPKEDRRSGLAKWIDYLAVRVLFFFMLVVVMSTRYSFLAAILSGAGGTVLLHFLLARAEKERKNRRDAAYKDYIARSHTYEQLMKMDAKSEYRILMAQVLNSLDCFSEVQPSTLDKAAKFDLIGKFKGFPVVIICNRYKKENEVCKSELAKFAENMKKSGVTRGIYLTTSSFSEWALDYVHSIKDELRIVLVDKEKLLEWISVSGHAIYPDTEKVKKLEQAKRMQERMVSLQKRETRNKRLMQAFFLVSVYLTILSFLMRHWLQDWMLYLYFLVAVANMVLGFVCYVLFRYTRSVIRASYTLEQFD